MARKLVKPNIELAEKYLEIAKDILKRDVNNVSLFLASKSIENSIIALVENAFEEVTEPIEQLYDAYMEDMREKELRKIDEAWDFILGYETALDPALVGGKVLNPAEVIKKEDAEKAIRYAEEILRIAKRYLKE